MQHRMKEHPLTEQQIDKLLHKSLVGRLATINNDGAPYVIPVHFVYFEGKVYVHGLPKGQKLDNIAKDSRVCFEVDEMLSIIIDEKESVCNINTEYNSVIIQGNAALVTNLAKKEEILHQIVLKYTPQFEGRKPPEKMVNGTAIIALSIDSCTGKYYQ